MRKTDWTIPILLTVSSALFLVNFLWTQLALVGIVASLLFFGGASTVLGRIVFERESMFFRTFFGVTTLLTILALVGMVLVVLGQFTEAFSLVALVAMAASLCAASIVLGRRRGSMKDSALPILKQESGKNLVFSVVLSLVFMISVAVAFRLLWLSRTGEGESSVWLTIPGYFILVYLLGGVCLMAVVFFTDLHTNIKLAFISVFSFLSHSLFLLVWYPGRFGDPWFHLGEIRYIVKTGMPYAYYYTLQNSLWLDLFKSKPFYSLIVFFNRMSFIDVYWIFITFLPLLWSVFSPLLAYRIAETLTVRRSKIFPSLAAIATLIFPPLVLWGAVSVANSFSFVFLFVSLTLLLLWMRQGRRQIWLMAFLTASVSLFAHPQAGLFAFIFLFYGTIVQKTSRRLIWIAGFILMLVPYPIALYILKASFDFTGFFQIVNFMAFQSETLTFLFVFALVGLVLGIRQGSVDRKATCLFFVFYVMTLFEYYLTRYGMTNLLYDAGRVLVISDFLLALLVPLGFSTLIVSLKKNPSQKNRTISKLSSMKINFKVDSRVIALILVGLFLSIQTTAALYQAYPQNEVQKVQPAAYELDAIQYINSDTTAQYVVLCEPSFATLAAGFLGADYSYRVFGSPEWEYPTIKMYAGMTQQPSIGYMTQAMSFTGAAVSYFVVSVRDPNFEQVVERTSEILPVNRVFGDGKLYVFKYPTAFVEKLGPQVKVFLDDGEQSEMIQTQLSYLVESEVNATLTLRAHTSYNVTEFPPNWAFVSLEVNAMPTRFDNSSDVNTFIYIKGLQPGDRVTVKWLFYPKYPNVGWKENSFKKDWHPSTTYIGIPGKPPSVNVNGSVFRMSYSFEPESYWYSYYVTSVGISTNDYPYLIIRWKCNLPAAVAYAYFEDGSGQEIVSFGGQSPDWVTTIAKLRSGAVVSSVMVGLTNAVNEQLSGDGALEISFIIIAG